MTTLREFSRELEQMIREIDRAPNVVITTSSSRGRTAAENAKIFEEQRAAGRDPLFVADDEMDEIIDMLETSIANSIETRPTGDTERALGDVGGLILDAIIDHVKSGASENGPMAPLAESTEKRKKAEVGSRPILVRTGQLIDSLMFELEK